MSPQPEEEPSGQPGCLERRRRCVKRQATSKHPEPALYESFTLQPPGPKLARQLGSRRGRRDVP